MDKKSLIREEQKILNDTIDYIDNLLIKLDNNLTREKISRMRINSQSVPDTYADLLAANYRTMEFEENIGRLTTGRDELYEYRIDLSYKSSDGGSGVDHLKVGRITLWDPIDSSDILLISWKHQLVRPYIMNPELVEYIYEHKDDSYQDNNFKTTYTLELKRKVNIRFETVKDATHLFPLTAEEAEKIIGDAFLAELSKRRSDKEFRDIIFSIQKKQGEIINQNFNVNIIVQGCAGSGKSMIMLHRLPILLYDNRNISRSSVYIISPSQSYIQQVNTMRKQLEIYDISMGSLNDYYSHAISRYKITDMPYKRIDTAYELSNDSEKYIYSDLLINEISQYLSKQIDIYSFDLSKGFEIFSNIERKTTVSNLPNEVITIWLLNANSIITRNKAIVTKIFNGIRDYLVKLKEFDAVLDTRVETVKNTILSRIAAKYKEHEGIERELQDLDETQNKKAVENRRLYIAKLKNDIDTLNSDLERLQKDRNYDEQIYFIKELVNTQLIIFKAFDHIQERNETRVLYSFFDKFLAVKPMFSAIHEYAQHFIDPYSKYTNSIVYLIDRLGEQLEIADKAFSPMLDYTYLKEITNAYDRMTELSKNVTANAYNYFMNKVGYTPTEKKKDIGIKYSPYVFLQILYAYYGTATGGESLIAIDEAQNLAINEIALIRNVNGDKTVLNLFGDEKQHIENTKGIDSWYDLPDVSRYTLFELNENYRNASQITRYCNRRFTMNMAQINLNGTGVTECDNIAEFRALLTGRLRKVINSGISAIIVSDYNEGLYFLSMFIDFQNKTKINNMLGDNYEMYENKWNLMTIGEAKGLEFTRVITIMSNMTVNEQYIACTRALDELLVYTGAFDVPEQTNIIGNTEKQTVDNRQTNSRTESKYENGAIPSCPPHNVVSNGKQKDDECKSTGSELCAFLKSKGLELIDLRSEGGYLWILGKREDTVSIIQEARSLFHISSIQYGYKEPNVQGWYTKCKK